MMITELELQEAYSCR